MNPRLGRLWDLLWMLTRTEFRLRDQGTLLGFLWTLLHPLLHFLILYALFTEWMGARVGNYAAYLLVGIVPWNFFATATGAGLTSLRRKESLIANFSFPPFLVVLSSVFSVLLSHLLEWGVLLAALLVLGVEPRASWLAVPFLVALELALAVGVSAFLSLLAVECRDMERAWGILLYGLFFLTPVFYTADVVGETGRRLLEWNPLAIIIGLARAAVLGGPPPAAAPFLVPAAIIFCVLSLGLFPRLSRGIAERL